MTLGKIKPLEHFFDRRPPVATSVSCAQRKAEVEGVMKTNKNRVKQAKGGKKV